MTNPVVLAFAIRAAGAVVDTIQDPGPLAEATGVVVLVGGVLTALTALVVLVGKSFRTVRGLARGTREFLEDWNGQEARPGHPGVPGVPERLADLQSGLQAVEAEQVTVRRELKTNGGTSIKDAITRIEQKQEAAEVARNEAREENDRERALDREAVKNLGDLVTGLIGGLVGAEVTARVTGHEAQVELFKTMQTIQESSQKE